MLLSEAETNNGPVIMARCVHTSRGRRPGACGEVRHTEPGRS